MKQFKVMPEIYQFDSCSEFVKEFKIGKGDLIFTNPAYFEKYFEHCAEGAKVIYAQNYGKGEPSDHMVDKIAKDIAEVGYKRVIAIGGGSIIDVAKLLVQETIAPAADLFDKKIPAKKVKELVIVPTTCGTGSEVTGVSVLEIVSKGTKMGLQTGEEYADAAVLIPVLLEELPRKVFAASSIDALIHAMESYMSPKATPFSEMFSVSAIKMILNGYKSFVVQGEEAGKNDMEKFLLASTYAGIAFGNAGCAAVHAMSMSFSGTHHVPHGESNYILLTEIFKTYQRLKPDGKIKELNKILAGCLECEEDVVYDELEKLLNRLITKKTLHDFGVTKEELPLLVEIVETRQGRLTANNYTALSREDMLEIYKKVF